VFGQWAVASTERRAGFATLATISAKLGGNFVFCLPACNHFQAMIEAAIAFNLTSDTDLSTFFHHRISVVIGSMSKREKHQRTNQCG
jgi:hypothetical protein